MWLHLDTTQVALSAESRPRRLAGLASLAPLGLWGSTITLRTSRNRETATGSSGAITPYFTYSLAYHESMRVGYSFGSEKDSHTLGSICRHDTFRDGLAIESSSLVFRVRGRLIPRL